MVGHSVEHEAVPAGSVRWGGAAKMPMMAGVHDGVAA
ncbi:hypothetical protein JOF36_007429 [Pseudonocardia parietis]|uniref:Uncharacterized protein n=1 Tax=Pseudonocardia parietis TaxID=570936 RepID=A0ABS4W629_9PSEU|nr:hypothetical protein [Pseudonocardia parietis]